MKITKEEILHVADLARIEVDDLFLGKLSEQIADILDYVKTLESADTEGVVATSHDISMKNVFREDEVCESLPEDRALANAPESEMGCFVVPKSIG